MEVLKASDVPVSSIVESWAISASWAPMIFIFTTYLFLVLKVGPKFMETRKPFQLTNFTRVYNILQVILCTVFVTWALKFGLKIDTFWKCLSDFNDREKLLEYKIAQWWFLHLRLAELIETVVFVLRKKQNQVSLLHVYHHISTATIIWMFMKYCSTIMDLHTAFVNSFVHIFMYFYYFLSSYKSLDKYTKKAKPFITGLQLIQLVIILGQNVAAILPSCHVTRLFYVQAINAAILIYFFADFYIQSYVKKKQK
ncbi:CLUMA_CG017816, isoform A [Clunio marinus]|uniref:Elongation of very long chain fatty acids protein n=1 Tax=Clunio marinus TaxID=568069 RepID=A0A1J1IYX7_9DIPT|nr:CLUMA_CG017816, isoform A [Clunio marinus]